MTEAVDGAAILGAGYVSIIVTERSDAKVVASGFWYVPKSVPGRCGCAWIINHGAFLSWWKQLYKKRTSRQPTNLRMNPEKSLNIVGKIVAVAGRLPEKIVLNALKKTHHNQVPSRSNAIIDGTRIHAWFFKQAKHT